MNITQNSLNPGPGQGTGTRHLVKGLGEAGLREWKHVRHPDSDEFLYGLADDPLETTNRIVFFRCRLGGSRTACRLGGVALSQT